MKHHEQLTPRNEYKTTKYARHDFRLGIRSTAQLRSMNNKSWRQYRMAPLSCLSCLTVDMDIYRLFNNAIN